jgi:monothiol glutaredoxin
MMMMMLRKKMMMTMTTTSCFRPSSLLLLLRPLTTSTFVPTTTAITATTTTSSSSFHIFRHFSIPTTTKILNQQVHFSSSSFSSSSSSSSSHNDFAAQPKQSSLSDASEEQVHAMIRDHVTKNPIMLYMKGNPQQPQCGFSATVVSILQSYPQIDFASVNVLDYPTIRQGIKTYSQWPTVPQLYIHGEFVGGCDIVQSLHAAGELQELLQNQKKDISTNDDDVDTNTTVPEGTK